MTDSYEAYLVQTKTYQEGADAAAQGVPYDENPYSQDVMRREWWSRGHKGFRGHLAAQRHRP